MTQAVYGQLEDRLDELAAGRFLLPPGDGFAPPPPIREELYARTRDLAKTARASGSGLS